MNKFDCMRVLIATDKNDAINEWILVEVNGISYNVKVCEEGGKSEHIWSGSLEEVSMVEESQPEKVSVQVNDTDEEE